MNIEFQSESQLADAIVRALESSVESPDLYKIEAVHEIIGHERARGFDGLCRMIRRDPVDFVLAAVPGFARAFAVATGHTREKWASVFPKQKACV